MGAVADRLDTLALGSAEADRECAFVQSFASLRLREDVRDPRGLRVDRLPTFRLFREEEAPLPVLLGRDPREESIDVGNPEPKR